MTEEGSGGAADASLSAGVGTPTLDGFGIVGGNIHTPEEYAEVESVAPRIYLLSRMIMELAKAHRIACGFWVVMCQLDRPLTLTLPKRRTAPRGRGD